MSQTITTPHTSLTTRRKTAFAIGAIFVMVGVAFGATMHFAGDAETTDTNGFGSGSADDPITSLAALSAPLPGFDGAASGALSQTTSVHGEASARIESSIADAQGQVDAAASKADDVLTGTDGGIEAHLRDFNAYSIEDLRATLGGEAGASFLWNSMPSTVRLEGDEIHFEATGREEVDSALLQAEAIVAQIQAMWGSAEVQTLFATADQTAGEQGLPVTVPGILRSPFGADDAVEPDEAGALSAQAHADALLSTVGGGYGQLHTGLQTVRASQVGLAGDVDGALAGAAAFQSQARAAVAAQHASRLDAIAGVGTEYEARLSQSAEAYLSGVTSSASDAQGDIDATLAAQRSTIENSTADAHAQLDAHLATVRSEADARLDGIATAEASVHSSAQAGMVGAADAEAFFAASAAAKAQIEAQVAGAEAEVDAIKAQVQGEADAHVAALEALVADARAELEGRVAEAQTWSDAQVALLTGDIDGALSAAATVQTQLRAAAETSIDQAVAQHTSDIEVRAYQAIADARAYATTAQATVAQVQSEAYAEVGNDLSYIEAVVQDYSSVPTPERQAAAQAWAQVQGELDSTLGSVLVRGGQIGGEASAVMDAAAQAEAALSTKF